MDSRGCYPLSRGKASIASGTPPKKSPHSHGDQSSRAISFLENRVDLDNPSRIPYRIEGFGAQGGVTGAQRRATQRNRGQLVLIVPLSEQCRWGAESPWTRGAIGGISPPARR